MGWGEFEASIRIIWRDDNENNTDNERPILLTHLIKLYPNNAPSATADPSTYMNTAVPVVSEKYDEVVFTNPKVSFHKQLLDGEATSSNNNSGNSKNKKKKNTKKLPYPLSKEQAVIEHFRTYGDEHEVKAVLAAKEFLQRELRNVKDRLIKVDEELEDVKGQLLLASTTTATTTGGGAASSMGTGGIGSGVTSSLDKGGTTTKQESGKTSAGTGKTSSSKGSKKKKASASNAGGGSSGIGGGSSGEPASKKAKSS